MVGEGVRATCFQTGILAVSYGWEFRRQVNAEYKSGIKKLQTEQVKVKEVSDEEK